MNSDRIKEIQEQTAYPESVSVMVALKQVWNECEQEQLAIQRVSQQRELLNAFQKHYQSDGYDDEMSFDWNISNFLKAFNCG